MSLPHDTDPDDEPVKDEPVKDEPAQDEPAEDERTPPSAPVPASAPSAGLWRFLSDTYATADPRSLGLFRIALGILLFVDAARLCEQALRELRGRPEEPGVLLDLGRALLGQDKPAEGRRVLQDLVARHADTPAAAQAAVLLKDR